jgi:hypothetical protein
VKSFFLSFYFLLLFFTPIQAYHMQELLFEQAGVCPLVCHAQYPEVIKILSAEQFMELVCKSEKKVFLVCASERYAARILSFATNEQRKNSFYVDSVWSGALLRSIAQSLGEQALPSPSVGIFTKGAAELPFLSAVKVDADFWKTLEPQDSYSFLKVFHSLCSWVRLAYDWVVGK